MAETLTLFSSNLASAALPVQRARYLLNRGRNENNVKAAETCASCVRTLDVHVQILGMTFGTLRGSPCSRARRLRLHEPECNIKNEPNQHSGKSSEKQARGSASPTRVLRRRISGKAIKERSTHSKPRSGCVGPAPPLCISRGLIAGTSQISQMGSSW